MDSEAGEMQLAGGEAGREGGGSNKRERTLQVKRVRLKIRRHGDTARVQRGQLVPTWRGGAELGPGAPLGRMQEWVVDRCRRAGNCLGTLMDRGEPDVNISFALAESMRP